MKTKWIYRLINVCATALIILSVYVLLTVVMTPAGQIPQVLGFSVLRVVTGSMEPEIPVNAMLIVRKTEPEAIQPGDVISFFSLDPTLDGAVNTHRVVAVERQGEELWFTTKGDANFAEDVLPVDAGRIVGKVVYVSTGLGTLVGLLTNPLVFGLAIFLPLLVILLMNLYRTARLAADIAKQEEEAAVRQALKGIQEKKANSGLQEEP